MQTPTPHNFYTADSLARITRGRWLVNPRDPLPPIHSLAIDSRAIQPDQIFLAIAGPNHDGHDFINHAADRNAPLAIVSKIPPAITASASVAVDAPMPLLMVDDCVAALHRLAHAWRDVLLQSHTRVIAVAGSNGKTTTRHLIHHTLHNASPQHLADDTLPTDTPQHQTQPLAGIQSPNNFNNHLGLPLTLLAAQPEHDFVVAEIATDRPGDIEPLARIARPDIAVLTTIGHEHLAQFKTIDAVADEQAALFDHLQPDALAVIHDLAYERIASDFDLPRHAQLIRFGLSDDADLQPLDIQLSPAGLRFDLHIADREQTLHNIALPLLAPHNALNASAAIAIAMHLDIPDDQILQHLATAQPFPGRLQPVTFHNPPHQLHLINDTYNANPESTIAALNTLLNLAAPPGSTTDEPTAALPPIARRVAILGDMLDLGDIAPDAHRQLGNWLAKRAHLIDLIILVGPLCQHTAQTLAQHDFPHDRLHPFPDFTNDLPDRIASLLQPNDLALLKASRGMRFERLLPPIHARFQHE